MFDLTGLNWVAVLGATVAGFALGGVWYGPLFGRAWMAAIGKTEADIKPSATPFIISFITALITAVVLAMLIGALVLTRWVDGLMIGLLTGVGFIATAMASDSAFCGWGVRLWLIQAGYRVVYSVIMGILLVLWP
jgi:hypothetical protein